MKAVLTFVFFIFITTSAMAQATQKEVKVETTSLKVELNIKIEKETVVTPEVARLYRYKNSRVKKALKFSTKANKAKMA